MISAARLAKGLQATLELVCVRPPAFDDGDPELDSLAAELRGQGVTVAVYRSFLQQRYRTLVSALRDPGAVEEN